MHIVVFVDMIGKYDLTSLLVPPSVPLLIVIITASTPIFAQNNSNYSNFTELNASYERYTSNMTRRNQDDSSGKTLLFKDFIAKFHPKVVFKRIQKRKAALGQNASITRDFDEIFKGIDPTDVLLSLNVEAVSGRRKWEPPGEPDSVNSHFKDQFSLRMRIFELIRHTLYRTRNKLVIMQQLRDKYRDDKLYKMGFLMSKTDKACKLFHGFAFKAFHPCITRYYDYYNKRYYIISMMHAEERLNNKWFEIELLKDLIQANHESAMNVTQDHEPLGRRDRWNFVD